jgi:ketosteroid isomerase-like protein
MRPLIVLALLVAAPAVADTTTIDAAAEARALVDRWLDAQNRGDLAAYQALYATRFTGVRRSGPRTVRLDRAGWMADRARMFKKKMRVTAADVTIAATPSSARVIFTQTFEQGAYRDVGKKQIVVVREEGAPRIAREEMLSSTLVAPSSAPAANDRFRHVIDGGVVLSTAPDDAWVKGSPRFAGGSAMTVVYREVAVEKLPRDLAGWIGRRVRLFRGGEAGCEAAVAGLRIVGRVYPHFGTVEQWKGMKERDAAPEAWDLTVGGRALVARLDAPCAGADWARAASLDAPAMAAPRAADGELRAAALRAFRKLAAHRQLQKAHDEDAEARGKPWDEDGGTIDVVVLTLGEKRFVSVSARAGEGCGSFEGRLWAIWEVSGPPAKPVLTLRGSDARRADLVGVLDSDADGIPEILWRDGDARGLLECGDKGCTPTEDLSVPFLDCGC